MRRFLSALALLVCVVPQAYSAPDGEQLLQGCSAVIKQQEGQELSVQETFSGFFCLGYVSGLTDMVSMFPPQRNGRRLACIPTNGVSNDQIVRIVVKWLREHPESLHMVGRTEVLLALTKAFPCVGG